MPFFPYAKVPAMCQPCVPADSVLIVSVRVLEYLCCLCGRHVANAIRLVLILIIILLQFTVLKMDKSVNTND
jgi:hypothetical protein